MVSVSGPLGYRARWSATRCTKNRGTDQANASLPKFPRGSSRVISFKGGKSSSHSCSQLVSVLLFVLFPSRIRFPLYCFIHIFPLSVLSVGRDTNEAALSNSPVRANHKGILQMQRHILLTRYYHADGCNGYGFDEEAAALAGMCVWLPENVLGVNMISWNRIWFLDCYLPRSWERLG